MAVCAHRPQVGNPTFVYIPRTGNVLRERERHIAALEGELELKNGWLEKARQDLEEFDRQHQELLALFREQKADLERSNEWAESLNRALDEARARIAGLQQELEAEQETARCMAEGYEAKSRSWKPTWPPKSAGRATPKNGWKSRSPISRGPSKRCTRPKRNWKTEPPGRCGSKKRGARLAERLTLYRTSRWVRLGRKVGLGPQLPTS